MYSSQHTVTSSFKKELDAIIQKDPLTKLTTPQRELLWKFRHHCSTIPEALPKLLRCVAWGDLAMVTEVHHLLRVWRPITLEVALELLDYHFADEKVRSLAVKRLRMLSNDELRSFLLQLVQVGVVILVGVVRVGGVVGCGRGWSGDSLAGSEEAGDALQ